jgi:hypothetical protein
VPSVASDQTMPAVKPAAAPAPRPVATPVSDSAAISPFESLLDDSGATSAPEPPPPSPSAKAPAPQAKPGQPPIEHDSGTPPKADNGTNAAAAGAAAQPNKLPAQTDSNNNATAAGATNTTTAKTTNNVPATVDIQAAADPAPNSKPTTDTPKTIEAKAGGDGKPNTDATALEQAAAGDGLKPASKDKPAESSKSSDDKLANSSGAGQAATAANVVVTVVTAPVTPAPVKSAAKDAAIGAVAPDGAPKTPQVIGVPLQAGSGKPVDDAKTPGTAAAPSGGKPQPAAGDTDKPSNSQANGAAATPAHHATTADAQPVPIITAHAAAPKAAPDAPPPVPVTTSSQSAATAPANPAPQQMPLISPARPSPARTISRSGSTRPSSAASRFASTSTVTAASPRT